jgi:predicted HicB family RNase H-like nuclease
VRDKSLNLRSVPDDLIRHAKSAAALQGITLREWVLKAIEEKLANGKRQVRSEEDKRS